MPTPVRVVKLLYSSNSLAKKGTYDDPNNYRVIALTEIFSKVYIHIINKRLTFNLDIYDKISECQGGVRSGYSTIDKSFVLNVVISRYLWTKNFNKAFKYSSNEWMNEWCFKARRQPRSLWALNNLLTVNDEIIKIEI